MVKEVTTPHTQLNTKTNAGVSIPSFRPAMPCFAWKGKTINSWTIVGNRLNRVPLENGLDLRTGKKNKKPQMPPQTIRGYNQLGFNAGEMDTPNDLVIPKSPDNHITRLFTSAPKHPAAKKINTFFIVFSHKFRRLRKKSNSILNT